jgi:hypothetical protein
MGSSFSPSDKRWFKELVAHFEQVSFKSDASAQIQCPDPHGWHNNGDKNRSATVDLSQNGKGPTALVYCHSQKCETVAMLQKVGLEPADLYPTRNGSTATQGLPGCSLEEYATSKGLPVDFLNGELVGLKDSSYYCRVADAKVPAIWIPYMDESGTLVAERYRTGLYKLATGEDTRFRWAKGSTLTLYGRNWLDVAQEAGFIFVVEGESDCHVAWYNEVPAIGVPGAQNWRNEWGVLLDGIDTLIVTVEDEAGERLFKAISGCERLAGRVERVDIR